ncbi:MAG: phosphogluconate dehydrogenase (NAD(+)-dependent, decarboxylating) [Candidatus Diapherotrites archaeon]
MKIGFIGLGKMGKNLVLNLVDHKYSIVAYNRTYEKALAMKKYGVTPAKTLQELCEKSSEKGKRIIWIMITAGNATTKIIEELEAFLTKGDIVIDGGNSNYNDSIKHAKLLAKKEIEFLDIGTSGGISGARNGACLMIGGKQKTFKKLEQVFKDISVKNGYAYCGKNGSGHFVKMIHNGIEYGMMQSIAEGFELIHAYDNKMNKKEISRVWNNGSVIRGWLMELAENAFRKDSELKKFSSIVGHSGEGKWTIETALELGVPTPVIANSLFSRFRSFEKNPFSGKVLSALRYGFGEHESPKIK